jgi:hypothetical protein
MIMFALNLSTMAAMSEMVIIPAAGNLFHDFAGTNIAALNYILSLVFSIVERKKSLPLAA